MTLLSTPSSLFGSYLSASPLVVASHNASKAKEIAELLQPFAVEVLSAATLGVPEPAETEPTFAGNALLKARHCLAHTGLAALADDSGLVIPALNGEPGIHSARWAEVTPGGPRDFAYAMARVEEKLKGQHNVPAYMISVLCLIKPDGHYQLFEGRIDGVLVFPGRGVQGFGYDAIFQPQGYEHTFAQMERAFKHSISHRAIAFQKLVDTVFAGTQSDLKKSI